MWGRCREKHNLLAGKNHATLGGGHEAYFQTGTYKKGRKVFRKKSLSYYKRGRAAVFAGKGKN